MANTPAPLDSVLQSVAETRGKLDACEQYWKRLRQESRTLAVQLILDHGYSVNKVAHLTGHQRITLKTWVDIEELERQKAGTPAPDMDPLFTDG